jgi:Mg2+ and Co2+ transporter CorA
VTSVLLVPTFIAGTFGANTEIPGQGKWWGFVLMVILMVLGAVGTYALIRPRKSG